MCNAEEFRLMCVFTAGLGASTESTGLSTATLVLIIIICLIVLVVIVLIIIFCCCTSE
jgi:hypothetical protein